MKSGGAIERLVRELSGLPGIGPKTAQRLAFYLLSASPEIGQNLAQAILEARNSIKYCSVCANLTDKDPCRLCDDVNRTPDVICVVQDSKDVMAMEKSHGFRGLYHVLHGALQPSEGIGPDQLSIRQLLKRLEGDRVKEVILATNSNVEGDATAMYLAKIIKPLGIKVTRIAHGLPVGSYLEYADQITLAKAMEGRREMQ
ncbi:MAG: recombination protein RecR [Firmicutes bacterium]|nr:recombination protein RecR [Bacillota bacterium]